MISGAKVQYLGRKFYANNATVGYGVSSLFSSVTYVPFVVFLVRLSLVIFLFPHLFAHSGSWPSLSPCLTWPRAPLVYVADDGLLLAPWASLCVLRHLIATADGVVPVPESAGIGIGDPALSCNTYMAILYRRVFFS